MFSRKIFGTTFFGRLMPTAGRKWLSIMWFPIPSCFQSTPCQLQCNCLSASPKRLSYSFSMNAPMWLLFSNQAIDSFRLEKKERLNCEDVVELIFRSLFQNCLVFSKTSLVVYAQLGSCQDSKRSRDSSPTSTESKRPPCHEKIYVAYWNWRSEAVSGILYLYKAAANHVAGQKFIGSNGKQCFKNCLTFCGNDFQC